MTVEWDKLTDEDFESLCYDVLVVEGYKNLEWVGRRGGDRGRDILATKIMRMTEAHELMFNFLVQCKRYLARPPAPSDLQDTLAWADAHNPDVLLIMMPNTPTSDTRDWLDQIRPRSRYRILVYDEKDFDQFFDRNREVYARHFGKERVFPRKLVLSSLLSGTDQTIQTISSNARVSKDEVEAILRDLEQHKIVSHEGPETTALYHLERDLRTFADLAREFLDDETKRFEFISSEYCQSLIGAELVSHIASRYRLVVSPDRSVALTKLFKISPSALKAALFSPTDKYDTVSAHIEKLGLGGEERDRWNQTLLTEFVSTLLERALADLRDPNASATLAKNEVEGYDVGVKIKMANWKGPVFNLETELLMMLGKAGEAVKAGELLSPSDPGMLVHTGNIMFHLGLFEQAVEQYDVAIPYLQDKQLVKDLAGAMNNKGVCLMALRMWDKAIPCFDRALEIHPNLNEARNNKQRCEAALRQDRK